jgi:hypothetical protein
MGLEPTTFCMASKVADNDPTRRKTREAAFLHGFRASRQVTPHRSTRPIADVWATIGPRGHVPNGH